MLSGPEAFAASSGGELRAAVTVPLESVTGFR
jgi:hypothetical protein